MTNRRFRTSISKNLGILDKSKLSVGLCKECCFLMVHSASKCNAHLSSGLFKFFQFAVIAIDI